VLELAIDEGIMEDEPEQYDKAKLDFMLEEEPGYAVADAAYGNLSAGEYVLAMMLPKEAVEEVGFDESEMFNAKFCSIRESDLELCGCSGMLEVMDLMMQLEGMGGESNSGEGKGPKQ
jgi:hypothetical protein